MSYNVKTRLYQTNPNAFFKVVEKGAWHYGGGGTWAEQDGTHTIAMGSSGTCGMLRFMTEEGKEAFFVAMGVHNYKPWVDIVTGLANNITCVGVLHEYYENTVRSQSREAQRTSQSILNSDGRTIAANYKVADGHDLELNIVIG